MPSLTLEGISKRFGDVTVVESFDLEVADGELLVLVGGSGSGKSTILRMIAGLEPVSSGRIRIGERDITALAPRDRDVAMVFQDYALYPHLTVRENLSLGLRLRRMPKAEVERRVGWAAEVLGLATLLERKPKQLSGGQRQRVAMGRAMVREPAVFLFDEPLSNLDAALRGRMRIEIGTLQRRLTTTAVYVTHDQVEAMTLGDRIVVLDRGRIQQVGRPIDLYRDPVNRFVAGFIGTPPMNFVEGTVHTEGALTTFDGDGISMPIDRAERENGARITLGVRPEALALADGAAAENGGLVTLGRGRVLLVERLGGTSHVHVEIGPHRILAALTSERLPEVGEPVTMRVPPSRVYLFAADGEALGRAQDGDG